jgi:predicted TPR repeat methyltransferase
MTEDQLQTVYSADTPEKAEAAYDGWASQYDADLMAMGYRLPWHFAASVLRHIPFGTGPVLDAGCGTGLQVEPLHLLGWRGFTGIDLSTEMMEVARAKGLYADLQKVMLGGRLPFATDHFAASFCVGTMTPGHAPIETLDELLRVTRPGGHIAYSLRDDEGQLPHYLAYPKTLIERGKMREVFTSETFATMPLGEPSVRNRVHICEVLP